jgi:hypothetical protein
MRPIIFPSRWSSGSNHMSTRYQEFPLSERLGPFVECFWTVEPSDAFAQYPVPPDGCVDIVYSPGTARELQVVGAMTQARKFALAPGHLQFGVRFRPAMAQAFLPIPAWETTDRLMALSDIWGSAAGRLTEQISEAESAAGCIPLIEACLVNPREITLVQRLCASIVQQAGQVRIDDLTFSCRTQRAPVAPALSGTGRTLAQAFLPYHPLSEHPFASAPGRPSRLGAGGPRLRILRSGSLHQRVSRVQRPYSRRIRRARTVTDFSNHLPASLE